MKQIIIPIIALFLVSCEDYTAIQQEITKQTRLLHATTYAIQHAGTVQDIYAVLRKFNDEMDLNHAETSKAKSHTKGIVSLIASPPNSLARDVAELKKASAQLRETLAAASGYCEDAHLRNMLVKTITTLEKTLEQ
jgi:hypothetical protein